MKTQVQSQPLLSTFTTDKIHFNHCTVAEAVAPDGAAMFVATCARCSWGIQHKIPSVVIASVEDHVCTKNKVLNDIMNLLGTSLDEAKEVRNYCDEYYGLDYSECTEEEFAQTMTEAWNDMKGYKG